MQLPAITFAGSQTTGQLQKGDLVINHGMRLLIDRPVEVSQHHHLNADPKPSQGFVRTTLALVLNIDEVKAAGLIPVGWLYDYERPEPTEEPRWSIQGNDWATWYVVRTA